MPQPQSKARKRYGPLIRLPRVGKNKKIIYFYKMRTMHPYSEYIQKYVYDKYGSLDGDKAENDFRITTWGRFFRKVWIDELPMIINLLRGDMKLVGVRPLSKVKFDSYPKYLQDKRTLSKPGLIPPFYVDMPKTQEEMYDSEERYIDQYLKHPLSTDFKYFWKAFYMIVFKRARSH
ncbi:MAG: sugar transferase [Paludibacteraceae bacterium]|nr:sugar transferase [Paludibacteraceae bacterium]